jgi:hypothetical protein
MNIKNSDGYPYSDKEFYYWTGYYSSRSRLKQMIYESGRLL